MPNDSSWGFLKRKYDRPICGWLLSEQKNAQFCHYGPLFLHNAFHVIVLWRLAGSIHKLQFASLLALLCPLSPVVILASFPIHAISCFLLDLQMFLAVFQVTGLLIWMCYMHFRSKTDCTETSHLLKSLKGLGRGDLAYVYFRNP